jgi:hypothetical protein
MVASGANIMVEVQRQAMIDLARILMEEHEMSMPKAMAFQFDNCGENKVCLFFLVFVFVIDGCFGLIVTEQRNVYVFRYSAGNWSV